MRKTLMLSYQRAEPVDRNSRVAVLLSTPPIILALVFTMFVMLQPTFFERPHLGYLLLAAMLVTPITCIVSFAYFLKRPKSTAVRICLWLNGIGTLLAAASIYWWIEDVFLSHAQ